MRIPISSLLCSQPSSRASAIEDCDVAHGDFGTAYVDKRLWVRDHEPSPDKELGPTSDGGRRKTCQSGGDGSEKLVTVPQVEILLTLPPLPPLSSTPRSPLERSGYRLALSSLQSSSVVWPMQVKTERLPCSWPDLYDEHGQRHPCTLTQGLAVGGKTLQHWARQHVANEVFAIRRGIIPMKDAQIVRTPEELRIAILHLGLCPNPKCDKTSPYKIWENRAAVRIRHLTDNPGCKRFYQRMVGGDGEEGTKRRRDGIAGYRELGMLLGFKSPKGLKDSHDFNEHCQLVEGRLHPSRN